MTDTHEPAPAAGDRQGRRYETFSYLPEMDEAGVRRQIDHILERGWTCALEHVEADKSRATYWYMWKLPMFGVRGGDEVVAEIAACRAAHPGHLIRLIGYDSSRQTQGLAMVVHRGAPA